MALGTEREGRQESRTRKQAENRFTLGWERFGDCGIKAPGRGLKRGGLSLEFQGKSGLEMDDEITGAADANAVRVSKICQGEGTE